MSATTELNAAKLWIVLARCHRALAISAERGIADLGLCLSDFMVLEALLHKGPLTITEIQAKILLASGSMTAAVDRVEKMGLVIRKSSPEDRRAKVLELTPKGRRVIESAFQRHAEQLEELTAVLNAEERRSLYAAAKKLGHYVAATLDKPRSQKKK